MSEVFLKIVNMSISASWLILAVLVIRFFLKKVPKWVNVLLWGMVAVRLLCPFSIESALSLIPSTETISPAIMMDATPEIETGIPALNSAVNPVISDSFAPAPAASANPLQILIPLASVIWFTGIAIMLIYTAVSYISLRKKVATAVILRDNIFRSEYAGSPFVLGIIKPRIYLPYAMDAQNMEHVIAHEQAHIRRKDHWWKPLGFLLLSIHWFNPLMWVAYILLCRDIELACDEKVIQKLRSEQRADYTQALVVCSVNRRRIAACPLAFGEVGVKERVKSVMNYKKPAFWVIAAAMIICVIVAVCFLTDPKDMDSSIHELYFSEMGEQAELMQGESDGSPQDTIVSVKFYSSSGPTECSVAIWFRQNEGVPWTITEPVEMNISDSYACNIPANYTYAVMVTPVAGQNGYASFEVIEQQLENETISFGVQELMGENAGITEIRIRNLHNGQYSSVTDPVHIDAILDFISMVEGYNPTSNKEGYVGNYQIEILNGAESVFSIGFGDKIIFIHGDYDGDGYPHSYEFRGVSREDVLRFFSQFDTSNPDWGLKDEIVSISVSTQKGQVVLTTTEEKEQIIKALHSLRQYVKEAPLETLTEEVEDSWGINLIEVSYEDRSVVFFSSKDCSVLWTESETGQKCVYTMEKPNLLKDLLADVTNGVRQKETSGEPFADMDEPWKWMRGVNVNAIESAYIAIQLDENSTTGGAFTSTRFAEFLSVLNAVPEEAIAAGEVKRNWNYDDLCYRFGSKPGMSIAMIDRVNDMAVVFRYTGNSVEVAYTNEMSKVKNRMEYLSPVQFWTIKDDALLSFMQTLYDHPAVMHYFAGSENEWIGPVAYTHGNVTLSMYLISDWIYEVIPYSEDLEHFGIRCRPGTVEEGWIYFSFWQNRYEPEEENRVYLEGEQEGYPHVVSLPDSFVLSSGDPTSRIWSYSRYRYESCDYAIINDGADGWFLEYMDEIDDTMMFASVTDTSMTIKSS